MLLSIVRDGGVTAHDVEVDGFLVEIFQNLHPALFELKLPLPVGQICTRQLGGNEDIVKLALSCGSTCSEPSL
jgi:hypothetical protein